MNVVFLKPKTITLIDTNIDSNGIRTFIQFSKINKIKKYTIVSNETNLLISHNDLTKVKSYYENTNPHLDKILKRVGDLTRSFDQFNKEEVSLFNLYHAFASNVDTIYINEFDESLSECNLNLVIEAIKFERDTHSRHIIVGTKNSEKYQFKNTEYFSLSRKKDEYKQVA